VEAVTQAVAAGRPWQSPVRDRNSRRILEATREFVEEHGLETLSMRRLAKHAEISVTTLYNLFGDKRGLIVALAQHSMDAVGAAVLDITATDPIEQVWQSAMISVEIVTALPKAVVLAVLSDDQLQGHLQWHAREIIVEAIESAMNSGELRADLPPQALVEVAGAVYRHLLGLWATEELGSEQLVAGVLRACGVALLAVAQPVAREAVLERLAALPPGVSKRATRRRQPRPKRDPNRR
jgi:AcrR family transcriptional regulator